MSRTTRSGAIGRQKLGEVGVRQPTDGRVCSDAIPDTQERLDLIAA